MGKKPAARQGSPMWVSAADLPKGAGHPFYERLNRVLEESGFDAFVRAFLGLDVTESPPNHSTLSRTRRLIDMETHMAVFTWVLARLSEAGLVKGKTVGIDATTLEANAAMRSIERRDTGESYETFVGRLAAASGVSTPTRAELARFDRSRKGRKTSNEEWKSPQDPDAKVTKMKDGRTHLAHKAEQGVDLETGRFCR